MKSIPVVGPIVTLTGDLLYWVQIGFFGTSRLRLLLFSPSFCFFSWLDLYGSRKVCILNIKVYFAPNWTPYLSLIKWIARLIGREVLVILRYTHNSNGQGRRQDKAGSSNFGIRCDKVPVRMFCGVSPYLTPTEFYPLNTSNWAS